MPDPCPDVYDNTVPGLIAIGAGAVLAGVTIYLIVNTGEKEAPPQRNAYVVPTSGGAVAGFTMQF